MSEHLKFCLRESGYVFQGQDVFSACAIESLLNNEATPQETIIVSIGKATLK